MKRVISLFLVLLMITSLCACDNKNKVKETSGKEETAEVTPTKDSSEEGSGNLISNGDFSQDQKGWGSFLSAGTGTFAVENEQGVLKVIDSGSYDYSVQLYYDGFKLQQGGVYSLEFDASCNEPREMEARVQINGGDYHAYASQLVELKTDTAHYSIEFEMKDPTDLAPRLCFNCGTIGDNSMKDQQIIFDNVTLTLVDGSGIVKDDSEKVMKSINLNQLGYRPDDIKKIIFNTTDESKVMDSSYDIVDESGTVVFTGEITGKMKNVFAKETNYYGDFSKLTKEGTYKIVTENNGESYEFTISNSVYDKAFDDVIHMLYLQRCGCEITKSYGLEFAHSECHTDKAIIYNTDKEIDVSGGWHDAGDYGRYISAGAKAVADLLIAYDENNQAFSDNSNIPESGNGIPDVLDEVRYELEWMLKMQESSNGGVYHKVTGKNFPGEVLPEEETDTMYVSPISLTATGDFAAVMAMAYETYLTIDEKFAKQCLKAGEYAYDYLIENESINGFKNPKDIVTGEYQDKKDIDERYWAACQLYKATGSSKYKKTAEEYIASNEFDGFGWANVGGYGNLAYLNTSHETDAKLKSKITDEIIVQADSLVSLSKSNGYGISMSYKYIWGSNMEVLNNAMLLIQAHKLSNNETYLNYAYEHLYYIFGANPNSISFVTGYGTVSPKNTHHRPSMVVGSSMPGMLVGGTNSCLEDPYAKNVLADTPAAKCYADNAQCYSCNEVTIYWNSILIYVMSQLVK